MKGRENIVAIVRKEALLIWRDKLSVAILFLLPALILLVFGVVLSFEIKELHIAVINERHEPAVERLFAQIEASSSFHIVKRLHHSGEIAAAFGRDDIRMVIVAPGGFTRQLATGQYPDISLFIDASDPKLALAATSIARKMITAFVQEELPEMRPLQKQPVVRFLYNPGLRKETASVPGLMMIIFILISAIMLSISFVGEKERGTDKMLAMTPFSTFDIVLGKSLPYLAITIFHIFSVWGVSYFIFHIHIAGNPILFLALNLLFAVNSMAFGLLIASLVDRQLEVAIICWLFLFIPNVFMSGFIFPLMSMPALFRWVAWILPGTSFIEAYRNIVFKGVGLQGNALPFALLLSQLVLLLLASRKGLVKQSGGYR